MTITDHAITGPKTYTKVLLALLVLTVLTVAISRVDFGNANTIVAIVIASIKGALVALFFMHLRHDKFNGVVFVLGLFFLAVFMIWTLFDVNYRTVVLPSNLKTPVQAFPGAPLNKPIQPSTGQPLVAPPPAK